MKVKKIMYRLDDNAMRSIEKQTVDEGGLFIEKWNLKKKSKCLVCVEPNSKSLFFMVPILKDKKRFVQSLPVPSSLFLFQAKEFSKNASDLALTFKDNVTATLGMNESDNLYMIPEELYNSYLSYKISSLTSIVMFVESFVNSIIPEDFQIEDKKGEINGKIKVEQFWSLKDKLKTAIPKFKTIINKDEYKDAQNRFLQLNKLRNSFIHLKTTLDSKNMDPYLAHFEELINLDLNISISQTENLVRLIDSTYFS